MPNYYHRLDTITGEIAQSTCCDNTATERVMMAKLMTDSLVVWARDYKIDGFRFDLMGHQPLIAKNLGDESYLTTFSGDGFRYQIPRDAERYFGVSFKANF